MVPHLVRLGRGAVADDEIYNSLELRSILNKTIHIAPGLEKTVT